MKRVAVILSAFVLAPSVGAQSHEAKYAPKTTTDTFTRVHVVEEQLQGNAYARCKNGGVFHEIKDVTVTHLTDLTGVGSEVYTFGATYEGNEWLFMRGGRLELLADTSLIGLEPYSEGAQQAGGERAHTAIVHERQSYRASPEQLKVLGAAASVRYRVNGQGGFACEGHLDEGDMSRLRQFIAHEVH